MDESNTRERLAEAARAAGLSEIEIKTTLASGLGAGMKAPRHIRIILDPLDPMDSASKLMATIFIDAEEQPKLHRHRGAFWLWTGSYYRLAEDETIRATIWKFLQGCSRLAKDGPPVSFKPVKARVSDVLDALEAICQLDKFIDPPAWLNKGGLEPATEFFACRSGLLHLPTGKLIPPTPAYFGLSASEVEFSSGASKPNNWLFFLEQIFGDDEQAIEALQDWFGYALSPDTSQQKILLVVGPKRSGKGTVARILSALLGRDSVAGPTMSSLAETFGLEPLITKPLAIISDARIGSRTDKSAIVERLLSISGEDQMTVARKFRDSWHGRLATRFLILTNELPSLSDGSGALVGRFIVLLLTQSFFGKEDPALTRKLLTELPGILNWAIEGYRRLHTRGYFVQPRSAQDAVDEIEMLAAPVKAFIRDCCITGPGLTVPVEKLWSEWKLWSEQEGKRDPGTKQWFGRNLRSAEPGISISRPGSGDDREPTYVGIQMMEAPF